MNKLLNKPFVFMRHGETDFNKRGLVGGITDTALNDKGREQALLAQGALNKPWSVVACSHLQRTLETAKIATNNHLLIPFPDLAERNWGQLEGLQVPTSMVYENTPREGESWLDFQTRVINAIVSIQAEFELPLIVAHSGTYRVLCQLIKGSPYGPRIENAQPYIFSPDGSGGWTINTYIGD